MEPDSGEALLRAWLELTAAIWDRELVSGMTFNEAVVCNLLLHQQEYAPDAPLTATALCEKTNTRKSQMNGVLNGLERRGYLTRSRSQRDRRQLLLRLTPEGASAYLQCHQQAHELLAAVEDAIGKPAIEALTAQISLVNQTIRQVRQKGAL